MRLSFSKKNTSPLFSGAGGTTRDESSNKPTTDCTFKRSSSSFNRKEGDLLHIYKEHDERSVMECSVYDDDNRSSASAVTAFSIQSVASARTPKEHEKKKKKRLQKNGRNKSSSLKKLLCFSEEPKHHQSFGEEIPLKNQNQKREGGLVEYRPKREPVMVQPTAAATDQTRQFDYNDEYCPEGYRYLQSRGETIKTSTVRDVQEQRQDIPSTEDDRSFPESLRQMLPISLFPATHPQRSNVTHKTCSSSVSNTIEFEDSVVVETQDRKTSVQQEQQQQLSKLQIVERSTDGTDASRESQQKNQNKNKRNKSSIPILQLVDAKTRTIIPSMVASSLPSQDDAQRGSAEVSRDPGISQTEYTLQELVVRPTWTAEETTQQLHRAGQRRAEEDPNLVLHRERSLQQQQQQLREQSAVTTESMLRGDCHRVTKQVGFSVWNNFLLVPPPTLRQQSKDVLRVPTLPKKQLNTEQEEDELQVVADSPLFKSLAAITESGEAEQTTTEAAGTEIVVNSSTLHRTGVSFAAVDIPNNMSLDNTRNEVAWHRCMARKGARLLNSAGLRHTLKRKPSLKKTKSYKPSQELTTKSKDPLELATIKEEENATVSALSTSGRKTGLGRAKCTNIPLAAAFCVSSYPPETVGDVENDSDDDDSSIHIPVNTRLERTRSPVPLFKHRQLAGMYSFASEDDTEENAADHNANNSVTSKPSWMYYLFQQKKDDAASESLVMDTTNEEEETLEDSRASINSYDEFDGGEDLDDVGDLPAMKDELVYQAQQLGRSLSNLFETASTTSRGTLQQQQQFAEDQIIPIIVYQQPDSAWKLNATKIQSEDYKSPRMSLAL